MPVKYIPYYPNTVQGQAILDNITRTRRVLRYRDNDKVYDRIQRGMPYYELEKIESVGNNPENMLIRGECISACAYLKDKGIKLTLAILTRLLPAERITPRKFIYARIRKLLKPLPKQKKSLSWKSSDPLKKRCTATSGIRKIILIGCMKIFALLKLFFPITPQSLFTWIGILAIM